MSPTLAFALFSGGFIQADWSHEVVKRPPGKVAYTT